MDAVAAEGHPVFVVEDGEGKIVLRHPGRDRGHTVGVRHHADDDYVVVSLVEAREFRQHIIARATFEEVHHNGGLGVWGAEASEVEESDIGVSCYGHRDAAVDCREREGACGCTDRNRSDRRSRQGRAEGEDRVEHGGLVASECPCGHGGAGTTPGV